MQALLGEIRAVAAVPVPILLAGESGVGKEIVGRLIHRWSGRAAAPFVPVNAALLRGELFESVVFGHARGAFTGAVRRHEGLAAASCGGTLFLDEIGELDPTVQARLLRFLDSGEYLPLGESAPRVSGARIVAATNRDLWREVERESFRADLYYRLAAVVFRIPPLRERPGDIPPIAAHILSEIESRFGIGPFTLSPRALAALRCCDWPGNVRQLRNELIAAAVRRGRGAIATADLSTVLAEGLRAEDPPAQATLDGKMRCIERREILEALRLARSNCSRAAEMLGLKRTTLIYRLQRHGIVLRERGEDS